MSAMKVLVTGASGYMYVLYNMPLSLLPSYPPFLQLQELLLTGIKVEVHSSKLF